MGVLRKPRRDFRLQTKKTQTSDFRLQASDFRLQASDFRLQASGFRLQASGFRLQASGFRLQASDFRLQASGFRLQTSGFRLQTSINREVMVAGRGGGRTTKAEERLQTSDKKNSDFRLNIDGERCTFQEYLKSRKHFY